MYFTDRLAAPASTFLPPPPADATLAPPDPTGYLPDRASPTSSRLILLVPLTIVPSPPLMDVERRPQYLPRQRRLGYVPAYPLDPFRRSPIPLERSTRHHPPFPTLQPPSTPTPRFTPPPSTQPDPTRYAAHSATPPRHSAGTAGGFSPSHPSFAFTDGIDPDEVDRYARESREYPRADGDVPYPHLPRRRIGNTLPPPQYPYSGGSRTYNSTTPDPLYPSPPRTAVWHRTRNLPDYV